MALIFLSSITCVFSQDLNQTNTELDLNSEEMQEMEISDLGEKDSDENILTDTSKDNSKAYLILDNDADIEEPSIGDHVTWIVSVTNMGPDTAKNVKVLDQLPDGMKYINHTTSKGKFNPQSGIWDIGNLSIDDGEVFLNILTNALSAGEKINKATLTSDSDNLNDNESYEEEEVNVVAKSTYDQSAKALHTKSAHVPMMPPAGNPIALIVISLFGIFAYPLKKFKYRK